MQPDASRVPKSPRDAAILSCGVFRQGGNLRTCPVGPVACSSPSCSTQKMSAASSMSHRDMPAGSCRQHLLSTRPQTGLHALWVKRRSLTLI